MNVDGLGGDVRDVAEDIEESVDQLPSWQFFMHSLRLTEVTGWCEIKHLLKKFIYVSLPTLNLSKNIKLSQGHFFMSSQVINTHKHTSFEGTVWSTIQSPW